tara:strand:+ start:170 stop:889 length:720 start_codon:yes stop_codon:yes gene_type:complete
MGLKRFIKTSDVEKAKRSKLPVSKNGNYLSKRGNAIQQTSRFPQLENSISSLSYYNPNGSPSPMYYETQQVTMFGRTEYTTKDVLRFGLGELGFSFSPITTGMMTVDLMVQGSIVGGTDGNIGHSFQTNIQTLFRFDGSTVTQVGTTGGKITPIFADSGVGSPSVYISYNENAQTTTNASSFGQITFLISNTGNKITEWTGECIFRLSEFKMYQSRGGGAIWQDGNPILFQNQDRLLWN